MPAGYPSRRSQSICPTSRKQLPNDVLHAVAQNLATPSFFCILMKKIQKFDLDSIQSEFAVKNRQPASLLASTASDFDIAEDHTR